MSLRFKLPPGGDVPPVTAGRRLGLSLDAFNEALSARSDLDGGSIFRVTSRAPTDRGLDWVDR